MALKVFRLEQDRDLPAVLAIRHGSARYHHLRARFQAIFAGKRCLVIGSAPQLEAPAINPDDVAICVNGSAHNAGRLGITQPDATFLVSHVFGRTTRQSRATFDVLHGRHTRNVFVFTGTLALAQCLDGLAAAALAYDTVDEISAFERAAIVGDVCGVELGFGKLNERVSTGVTAAICALWGGAREVNLSGFSLRGGHSYTKFGARRLHTQPDMQFLTICAALPLPLTTTSPALAAQFGLLLQRLEV